MLDFRLDNWVLMLCLCYRNWTKQIQLFWDTNEIRSLLPYIHCTHCHSIVCCRGDFCICHYLLEMEKTGTRQTHHMIEIFKPFSKFLDQTNDGVPYIKANHPTDPSGNRRANNQHFWGKCHWTTENSRDKNHPIDVLNRLFVHLMLGSLADYTEFDTEISTGRQLHTFRNDLLHICLVKLYD